MVLFKIHALIVREELVFHERSRFWVQLSQGRLANAIRAHGSEPAKVRPDYGFVGRGHFGARKYQFMDWAFLWQLDAKGATMRRVYILLALVLFRAAFLPVSAGAHVGSPDIFYDGLVGGYPARITIRMPNVVPGRAEISARVQSSEPVEVSFLPLYSLTPITNAPPPDIGRLVTGETNLYSGELWLMSFGAYSVEVRIKGKEGEASTQIPITSVAFRQLPLPFLLGKILLVLASILVIGGIGIAAAAGREAILLPGSIPDRWQRRKGFF